jgi:hypothetical protein
MTTAPDTLAGRAGRLLDRLADSPMSLLAALLLANALALPYAGLAHDARLYAVQTAEKLAPGTFADDLYLRYGSQDRYSAFTLLMAPLAGVLGRGASFFCGYLASKALFLWGALRLVCRLLPDRRAAVLSLLLVSILPLPFGGNSIFHLNEPFLTPRLAACGLVLLGLERTLAGRPVVALLLLAAAFLLHPLMAVGGLLTFALRWLATRLTRRRFVAVLGAACVLAGAALCHEPLAARLFGRIDAGWRGVLLDVCYFIKPGDWAARDWVRLGWAALVLVAAARTLGEPARTFLLAVLLTALAGVLGSLAAVRTDYLLLLQTSPYRTVWLLEFLAGPLAFAWAFALARRGTPAARALALAVVLLATTDWAHDALPGLLPFLAVLALGAAGWRGLAAVPRHPDWLGRSALAGFLATAALLGAYNLYVFLTAWAMPPTYHLDIHPVQVLVGAPGVLYKLPLLAAVAGGTCYLASRLGPGRRFRFACLALWLGYQGAVAAAARWPWYLEHSTARYAPREFVVATLRERSAADGRPVTVYWPGDVREVWFEAGANGYFNVVQLSGCGFNRGTALEGQRRALLVRRFELALARHYPPPEPGWQAARRHLLRADDDEPAPTREDLFALCREDGLDFIVLEDAVEGAPCATDGRLYVYDCRQLRELERAGGSPCPPGPAGQANESIAASQRGQGE